MSKQEPTNARKSFGDVARIWPKSPTNHVRGGLGGPGALAARLQPGYHHKFDFALRVNELPFHMKRAVENGLSKEEIAAAATHLAFYAGWPPAMTALQTVREV